LTEPRRGGLSLHQRHAAERSQQHCGENCDYGDDDQQFYEREGPPNQLDGVQFPAGREIQFVYDFGGLPAKSSDPIRLKIKTLEARPLQISGLPIERGVSR
jgi:hypothetical protein